MSDYSEYSDDSMSDSCQSNELMHECSLSNAISCEFLNEATSDVTLIVGKQRLHVHKIILAARSIYFRALFYGNMKEAKQTEIELNETPAKPFKMLLEYVYSSRINLDNLKAEVIMEILLQSRRHAIECLESGIIKYLEKNLSPVNICVILDKVLMFDISALKKACIDYANYNAEKILEEQSFVELSLTTLVELVSGSSFYADEIAIFHAVRKWITQNKPAETESILDLVRLELIEIADLLWEVWPTKLFSEAKLLSTMKIQIDSEYEAIKYRGYLVTGKNLATEDFGAKVDTGMMPQFVLDGNCTDYDENYGYTWHLVNDVYGITIKLGEAYHINYIEMLILDLDGSWSSYFIEISVDEKKWFRLIDKQNQSCKSWQRLSFSPKIARFIAIVGTLTSSKSNKFCLVTFRCKFISNIEAE